MNLVLSHLDDIVLALVTLGGWIWHARRGEAQLSLRAQLEQLGKQLVHDLGFDTAATEAKLRDVVTSKALELLAKAGITGSAAAALVGFAVDAGVTELKRQLSLNTAIAAQLDALAKGGQGAVAAFVPPAKPLGLSFDDADKPRLEVLDPAAPVAP